MPAHTGRLLAAAAMLAAGAAAAFDAVTLADYSGEEIFGRFCASCHGESGRGDGPVARMLTVAVADLTTITRRYGEFPAARVRETIDGRGAIIEAHGTRAMPVWGYEFWIEEGGDAAAQAAARAVIDRLVGYIESIQSPPPSQIGE
jgi:mono/diheme cytochrome c family protein